MIALEEAIRHAGAGSSNWLRQVELFADLGEEQLCRLWAVAKQVDFPQGEFVFREGESGDTLYILKEGRLEVSRKVTLLASSEEKSKTLVILDGRKHPFFGEMALLTKEVRSATLRTLSSCETLAIGSEDFHRLCDADPSLGYLVLKRMVQVLADRLRRSNQDILNLTTALSLALRRK